jgi:hypothetical protein
MLFRIAAAMIVLELTISSPAAELYVSPDGDDAHPGTQEQPLRTLAAARDRMRGQPGDRAVYLLGGVHVLPEPLTLSSEDSADENRTVTYAAAPGEQVVISGGRAIGPWRKEGELLTADATGGRWRFRELFIGGERRPRARHPNESYLRVDRAGPDNRTSFSFNAGDLQPLESYGEAEVVFLHDWSISRVRVKAIDGANRMVSFTDPIGSNAPHYQITNFEPHPRYFMENAREYLDAPGEWWLDTDAGRLWYVPRDGETAENLQAVAPWLEALVVVRGDEQSGRAVRGLRFKNLTFAHCRWDTPRSGYAEGQANFHEARDGGMISAALSFELAENCTLENCRLEQLGGAGVSFGRHCHENRIDGCTLQEIAGNGVMIGETMTRTGSAGEDLVCRGNRVENCTIERCGELYYGAVGVWVGIAQQTTIAHNEIRHLPYTGVSVGWRWDTQPTGCRENVVRDNHIHYVMQTLSDGGGIYTLGRQPGTTLSGNRIHDVPLNLGRAESNGMFIDEGSSLLTIENNTIYHIDRSPIRFHRAESNTLRNNRLVCAPGVPPFQYNSASAETMTMEGNEVIEAEMWTPPADDPTAGAGPQ